MRTYRAAGTSQLLFDFPLSGEGLESAKRVATDVIPACAKSSPESRYDLGRTLRTLMDLRDRTADRARHLRPLRHPDRAPSERWERLQSALRTPGRRGRSRRLREGDLVAEDFFTMENGADPDSRPPAAERERFRLEYMNSGWKPPAFPHDELLVRGARQDYMAEYETPAVDDSPMAAIASSPMSCPPPLGCARPA